VLDDVLYADLNGYFLVVGCTLFISLVNCLSIFNTSTLLRVPNGRWFMKGIVLYLSVLILKT